MFEARVLHLLRRYLGEYVRGLSVETLTISVWKGDVVLKDLQLKAEALNALKLPITVKAGFLGSVTLKVPWNRLGQEPVTVLLDRIFVLAEPLKESSSKTEDKESWQELKRRRIEEKELTYLEAKDKRTASGENAAETSTWLGSLIATIVGNLKISITNLHIRYEDTISNPGRPFCSGVTLAKLAAVTVDETGNETFVTSGALERLRKKMELQRLAVYHDSNTRPWNLGKGWEELLPSEWSEVFEAGLSTDVPADAGCTKWALGRTYLLLPVDGSMRYHRRGKRESREAHVPFQRAALRLDQVSVAVSEAQYGDGMKLLEGVSRYRLRMQFSQFRPQVSIVEDARAWWLYACQAILQQQSRVWYHLSWVKVVDVCEKRRKYVSLYASCLHQGPKVDNDEIKELERNLDVDVIVLWRLLAHAKMETAKSKEAAMERERVRKSGWWTFGRGGADGNSATSLSNARSASETGTPGRLTNEEWSKINDLLSYKPEDESTAIWSPEAPNMLQMEIEVSIGRSGAEVLDKKGMQILCGRFEDLQVSLLRYPKTEKCTVKLKFYGLSAPEGGLIESVNRIGRDHALTTSFVYCPLDEHLDWKLSATMSPCHVTVLRVSFDRFLCFLKSSQDLTPGMASETAAVLQSKLEEVTRRAQEQLQFVLEERSRFSVHLDLDAPKIAIPVGAIESGEGTQLLLDLGHFTLQTALQEEEYELDHTGLYSRFHISGSEISAFLADGPFEWSDLPTNMAAEAPEEDFLPESVEDKSSSLILPVLDRCGMSVVLDQIRVQHPSFPATRVQIKVPHLGVHFSPGRHRRMLLLLSALDGGGTSMDGIETSTTVDAVPAWHPADYAGDARVLLWGGIGNTVAKWQPCWAVLSGSYLYILENETAQSYQRCSSIAGKQVLDVSPESIGGSENVIAIYHRGADVQKAVESSHAVLLQLKSEENQAAWLNYLVRAAYRASVPVSISLPEFTGSDSDDTDMESSDLNKQPRLFVSGSLHELQISLFGSKNRSGFVGTNLRHEETLILQLQATGGKVDVLQSQCETLIGVTLHSLKIEDKLQGHVGPMCHYIARSVLSSGICPLERREIEDPKSGLEFDNGSAEEDDEDFDDALQDFGRESPDQSPSSATNHGSRLQASRSLEKPLPCWGLDEFSVLNAESLLEETFSQHEEEEVSDFVKMRFAFRNKESVDYAGVDTEINVRMATLDFFCNRPTVVALIDFGMEFNEMMDGDAPANSLTSSSDALPSTESVGVAERYIVKGLLGHGKSRIIFQLKMTMQSVRIYLNKEDGSQLAVLAQERFSMSIKVYPGSFSVSGMLGNLRICDSILGSDHRWGWLCDIRDPGCGSLVDWDFHSYNKDDDDYQGYEYSLSGKLSAVRLVYLHRFIQEIIAYFHALATPQVQQVIMVVDKVGGIEKLIQQSDMEGIPALKLNVSLDTPIIIMPKNSRSKEFMQLDLGHLDISNTFHWHGGGKSEPSAVHIDVLSAEVTDINMVVGIDSKPGKPMIEDASGIHITVQRPLRDLFKKVPELQVGVEVDVLCGVMSDKEYLVIIDCASTNLSEEANLPPRFRDQMAASDTSNQEFMLLEASQEADDQTSQPSGSDGQPLTTWTKIRWNIDVRRVELELYVGVDREFPLARLEIQKFWLNYCTTTALDMDLYITLPKLSVVDLRADTKPEMRLMLGSMSDVDIITESVVGAPASHGQGNKDMQSEDEPTPQLTMLVMDMRMKQDSQAIMVRVQRPRLLVVVDFLLAIGEFFVPSLGSITGRNEAMDVSKDPVIQHDHIRLQTADYLQSIGTEILSEGRQLVADAFDIDEFVYDGGGNSLLLDISEDALIGLQSDLEPLIYIGCNKHLRFKSIRIKNGLWLSKVVHLSCNSSYSAAFEDGVVLDGLSDGQDSESRKIVVPRENSMSSLRISTPQMDKPNISNFLFDVQAVAPELTFYDSTKWPVGTLPHRERLLRAKTSFNLLYMSKGQDQWIRGHVKSLVIEGGSGIVVVDPVDVTGEYTCVQDKTSMNITSSDISMRLSFNVISLILRCHLNAVSTFRFRDAQPVLPCTHFDRICVANEGSNPSQQVTIWRPRAPPGYAILSDCATSGIAPPSQAVMAVSTAYQRLRKPLGFEPLLSTCGDIRYKEDGEIPQRQLSTDAGSCWSVWVPVAPPGYVAVGCVAELGTSPPPLTVVHCVRSDLVTSGSVGDCLFYSSPGSRAEHENGSSIWRIENAAGSFFAHSSIEPPPRSAVHDLRELLWHDLENSGSDAYRAGIKPVHPAAKVHSRRLEITSTGSRTDSVPSVPSKCSRSLITTPQFERIWWDRGAELRRTVSIWRPIPPSGYTTLGDCLVEGLEPPSFGVALREDDNGTLVKPTKYLQRMNTSGKGLDDVYIWFPVAPAGYVAIGCIATKTQQVPHVEHFRCIHVDHVSQVNFSKRPLWSMSTEKNLNMVWNIGANRLNYNCSLWKVENQAQTFIARPDLKRPPARMAYTLAEIGKQKLRDNLTSELKIGCLSATVYDDLSGMLTPVVDMTVTNINLAAHGRKEAFSAVVITAIAASTFNIALEAWEPFIEPFDGIIKFESYDVSAEASLKIGKRFRITAANVVNMNLTSAAVEALVAATLSWRKQVEFEDKARMVLQVEEAQGRPSNLSFALEENNLEKVVVENDIGSDLYLRTFKENFQKVFALPAGQNAPVHLPPPKFPDKFMTVSEAAQTRHYAVVHVCEAKDVVVSEDGNGQDYLCALRVVPARQSTVTHKLLPQSGRSSCVRPSSLTQGGNSVLATVRWNEVFVFEVVNQAPVNLEVVVTNMAARGGKGQAVGVVSIPMNDRSGQRLSPSSLWDVVRHSLHLRSSWPTTHVKNYALQSPRKQENGSEREKSGSIAVSMFFFTSSPNHLPAGEKTGSGFQKEQAHGSDIGMWFSSESGGPWTGVRSVLAVGTFPRRIGEQNVAVEVFMQQSTKHVKFRSLVMVANHIDMPLAVCICPYSRLNLPDGGTAADGADVGIEEVFENQRFQPLAGWGSKWPGHLIPTDPGRWSSRDLSTSSQEFMDKPLPPGWVWTSDWFVDKAGHVDTEGWYHGENFQSLRLPPSSAKARKKSMFDFARRRRWVRTRQRVPENSYVQTRHMIGVVSPNSSISIPLSCIDANADFCVQVRPHNDPVQHTWGRAVGDASPEGSSQSNDDSSHFQTKAKMTRPGVPISAFPLNQLEKTEELLLCLPAPGVKSKTVCWLNMEADASILYTERNVPVYDWRLSVNAPFKLENRLPCKAEFIIWEKLREGNFLRKQQGVVSAGDSVYVYFVDLRRPIYLTWLAQGGWKPDLQAVLISDPSSESLPSGFWITHPQNGRKLRVSLENDFGNTIGSAKIVRLYVPYWLCDDAALPLSYRLVEIEPTGGSTGDNSWLNKAAKAAKQAARRPARVGESKKSHLHKVVQSLELLEDSDGAPAMLSLQAQSDRMGGLSLANNAEGGRLSPRLGLVITIGDNIRCEYALSFRELEENMERVEFNAADGNGAYYKISAFLDLSSDRTKVVHLQPQAVFVNRIGEKIRLRQSGRQREDLFFPNDAPRTFLWQSTSVPELLQIRMQNYKWSQPFSVDTEGIMQTVLEAEDGSNFVVQAEVCSEMQRSRFLVVFRRASFHATYRIENRSAVLPFRCRQAGGTSDSWKVLGPGSATSFAWEDLQRDRLLELLVDGADPLTAGRFCIDDVGEYQPMPTKGGPVAALNVRVCKEGLMKVVKVADWKPSDSDLSILPFSSQLSSPQRSELLPPEAESQNQFHAILDLAELGISIVDHTPEELLYMTMQKLFVQYATGLGSGTSRFKFRVDGLQIDNQLPLTPMPVLFTAQDFGNRPEFLLKLTATVSDHGRADYQSYPYIGIHGPSVPNVAFVVKLHEPVLWRLHEMFSLWNLSRLTSSQVTDVAIDPHIHIGLLHTTEVRLKVTLAMSPTQRPRGMLGFWSTLMTSLGNTDEMPIRINSRVQEEMTMRQSAVIATAISSIRNDVLSKPLSLLSGVDLLGNASTALGHMSKGIAALSMDKKFIRNRTRQDAKANVEDIGGGIREGGEALAKGFFRGVTGILTKPLEGARSSGMEGFVQGMGKGVIGAASQPVSGVLDFLSRTTEGANATRIKLTAAITFEEQMLRRRLPRVIGGDNVLRPYDEYKARGQVLMQLAERGAIFGPIDLFKVRGKFAMSDAYEYHFNLPKGRTLMITHRRIILLQHPQGFVVQKKADLLKDPCTVTWDVTWDDLMTTELSHGKNERSDLPPSRLIIHLRSWSRDERLFDSREIARIVKCHPGTKQAFEMRLAIQRAFDMYGPDRVNQAALQNRSSMRKPYSAAGTGAASGADLGLLAGPAAPVMATFGAMMGSAGDAMLETHGEIPAMNESVRSPQRSTGIDQLGFKKPVPVRAMQIGKMTTEFQLMWWDKGAPRSKKFQVSIWRPVPPAGFVSVGDVVQCCYEPPDKAMVYQDERDGKFVLPNGFDLIWRDTESGAIHPVTIWRPRPPAGYVAVGCVVVPDYCEPQSEILRCVRRDGAGNVPLGQVPLWRNYKGAALWHCSLWQVQNEARTFLARRDHQPPPPHLAFTVL